MQRRPGLELRETVRQRLVHHLMACPVQLGDHRTVSPALQQSEDRLLASQAHQPVDHPWASQDRQQADHPLASRVRQKVVHCAHQARHAASLVQASSQQQTPSPSTSS